MNHVLLLGAGFSRNWGGWLAVEVFEYLLGCPEIAIDPQLRSLLWRAQPTGGFEDALEQVQLNFKRNGNAERPRLDALQGALIRMFGEMNTSYYEMDDFGHGETHHRLMAFLGKFDAVFTLNQDVLLEYLYMMPSYDIALAEHSRWSGSQLPGMSRIPPNEPLYGNSWARSMWAPLAEAEYKIEPNAQPFFKLHGSSNWQNTDGSPLLIMGGQKAQEIKLHPVLSRYANEFENRLFAGGTKLMAIGYGFRDAHINNVIIRAARDRGLQLFIVSPDSSDLAKSLNPTRRAQIIVPTALETVFEHSLVGASRRPLQETFCGPTAELKKFERFINE